MTVPAGIREQVRQRAKFACEYCGVTETDTGGLLTVDHIIPQSKGGGDSLDNLVYCCYRCNLHKADYLPISQDIPQLWNPRKEPPGQHFVELANGALYPVTETGTFTINILHLNRPPLISYRQKTRANPAEELLLHRHNELLIKMDNLLVQQNALLEEQERILPLLLHLIELMKGKPA
jgi:hypothetical protein